MFLKSVIYHTLWVPVRFLTTLSNLFGRQSLPISHKHSYCTQINNFACRGGIGLRLDYEESFESFDQNCAAVVGGGGGKVLGE